MPEQTALHYLVPASLPADAYGPRLVEALRKAGWTVTAHALPGPYPRVDQSAILAADILVARLPDAARVLVDGAAVPGVAGALAMDSHRLRLVALVDDPPWREAGLELEAGEAAARRNVGQGALALMRRIATASADRAAEVAALGLPAERITVVTPDAGGAAALADVLETVS